MKAASKDVNAEIRETKRNGQTLQKSVEKAHKNLHSLERELHKVEHAVAKSKKNVRKK